jgi:hypothetical protein
MRNGDFAPNRLEAQTDACIQIAARKRDMNPENTVGVLTMAGKKGCVCVCVWWLQQAKPSSLTHNAHARACAPQGVSAVSAGLDDAGPREDLGCAALPGKDPDRWGIQLYRCPEDSDGETFPRIGLLVVATTRQLPVARAPGTGHRPA